MIFILSLNQSKVPQNVRVHLHTESSRRGGPDEQSHWVRGGTVGALLVDG